MHRSALALVAALASLTAPVGAAPAPATPKAAAPARPQLPKLRLPAGARPTRYAAELTIQPDDERFSGEITIDLELAGPTQLLWLNATRLRIQRASLSAGGGSVPATVVPGDADFCALAFARPVGAGPAQLHISYSGEVSATDTSGLFKEKEGGDWYLYTQLESTDARRVFPCFDEPAFKVPWQLTVHVPRGLSALSNTPVTSESDEPGGMKKVVFAATPPLPSYLVALAVGPFDFVNAGQGKKGAPLRIAVPRGRAADAAFAGRAAPELLRLLEDYFDMPYPLAKLDFVAIPRTVGFAAMENPGLVTASQNMLLAPPGSESIEWQGENAEDLAHEMAHMWFGDLVTMAWWDDTWLNEAFATWMATKIVDQWQPAWRVHIDAAERRSNAMASDGLRSARKIRQPIEIKDDIESAFGAITYRKGAAVLAMFEGWLGPETFKKGIQRYLGQHAWGNAAAADFLAALDGAAGREVSSAFLTFLDQPGVPVVAVELECKKRAASRVILGQRRYQPMGATGAGKEMWKIPLCLRYGMPGRTGEVCLVLDDTTAEIELEKGACPSWVMLTRGDAGYYRILYKGDLLARLLGGPSERFSALERVAAVGDMTALVASGDMPAGLAFANATLLAKAGEARVLDALVAVVNRLQPDVAEADRPALARWVKKTFGARARALGFTPAAGEDADTRQLRADLVGLVGNLGEDAVLRGQAGQLARGWLADRAAVAPDLVESVLTLSAIDGDRAWFDRLLEEAHKAAPRDRRIIMRAVGNFRDPATVSAGLALVLAGPDDVREVVPMLYGPLAHDETRPLAYDFIKQNFAALLARLPGRDRHILISAGARFCDEVRRADVEAFTSAHAKDVDGGPRIAAQTLEKVDLCIAERKAQEASIAAYLKAF